MPKTKLAELAKVRKYGTITNNNGTTDELVSDFAIDEAQKKTRIRKSPQIMSMEGTAMVKKRKMKLNNVTWLDQPSSSCENNDTALPTSYKQNVQDIASFHTLLSLVLPWQSQRRRTGEASSPNFSSATNLLMAQQQKVEEEKHGDPSLNPENQGNFPFLRSTDTANLSKIPGLTLRRRDQNRSKLFEELRMNQSSAVMNFGCTEHKMLTTEALHTMAGQLEEQIFISAKIGNIYANRIGAKIFEIRKMTSRGEVYPRPEESEQSNE
uniref:Uncharacterized protein n=1 Tax=Globodera pallida TaxID=36090 RepID=A0A183CEV5_GLOPA